MPHIDIPHRGELLKGDMTLENLFNITVSDGDLVAARWLEEDREQALTFTQYKHMAYDYAAYLQKAIGSENKGCFVAIQMETSYRWFPTFWGLSAAGFQVVLLDSSLSDEMTDFMLGQSGAVALIVKNKRKLSHDKLQILHEDLFEAYGHEGFLPQFGSQVALCTSGTTATSRIFVYAQEAICHQVLNSELLHKLNPRIVSGNPERSLSFLPYHHVFGFMVNLLWANYIGFESIFMKDITPEVILSTARRFKITFLCTVPLLANNLSVSLSKKVALEGPKKRAMFKFARSLSLFLQKINPDFGMDFARNVLFKDVVDKLLGPDVRCVVLGGSHTPEEHMRTISALGYFTISGFGMTETALTSVETSMNLKTRTSGSVGRPFLSAEYRVQSDGMRSNSGEMFIRGKSVHTGRLKDGVLIGPDLDAEGWYKTGDIVRLEKGMRMYVEGRSKDIIINESGENVYPDEVEDSFGLLEGADQYCVLGIKNTGGSRINRLKRRRHINPDYEDITLVLNVADHYRDDAFLSVLMRQVVQINNRLPILKRVTRVLATPERFQTANGIKVKRLALKELIEKEKMAYRDLDLKSGAASPQETKPIINEETSPRGLVVSEIKQKVRLVYAQTLQMSPENLSDDAHFITDLGGDSLQVLSLSLKVEELFSVLIPVEEYGECTTVNSLTSLLEEKLGQGLEKKVSERRAGDVRPIDDFSKAPEAIAFAQRIEDLLGTGLENPYFIVHDSALSNTSLMDGVRVLNFGSYNYAGMSGRQETKDAAKAAIDKYGTSASGSRLLAGEKSLNLELESELARWKHTEAALVLVGGHSTNVTFVGNFCGKDDLIVYDALAHNSVDQGCKLSEATVKPFPHNDVEALESILKTQRDKFAKVLIIIEGAYSMDGDIPDVPAFVTLKKKYGCFLMVDEAHSTCVIGD
ncbi:MAG: aminotransferase class I/II-fold pyridoxal phosphate-dependent enzyme, partial [Clostridiales bacterium]|nr:aminotransferase class I/II-fold pyridoxal phosphate-dependent enzyme [Clostridiales bacterium]